MHTAGTLIVSWSIAGLTSWWTVLTAAVGSNRILNRCRQILSTETKENTVSTRRRCEKVLWPQSIHDIKKENTRICRRRLKSWNWRSALMSNLLLQYLSTSTICTNFFKIKFHNATDSDWSFFSLKVQEIKNKKLPGNQVQPLPWSYYLSLTQLDMVTDILHQSD